MNTDRFHQLVLASQQRQAMPIATYPGMALTGATVRKVVGEPAAQVEIQAALQRRYPTGIVLSAMDLSTEAEAFGSEVILCGNLDPAAVFCRATPEEVAGRTASLLAATAFNQHTYPGKVASKRGKDPTNPLYRRKQR